MKSILIRLIHYTRKYKKYLQNPWVMNQFNQNMYIYNKWNLKLAFHNIGLKEVYSHLLKYFNILVRYYHFHISSMDNLEKMQNNYNIYTLQKLFSKLSILHRQYQQETLFGMYFFMFRMHRHQSNKHNIFYKSHHFLYNLDDPQQNIMDPKSRHLHWPIFKPLKVNK